MWLLRGAVNSVAAHQAKRCAVLDGSAAALDDMCRGNPPVGRRDSANLRRADAGD